MIELNLLAELVASLLAHYPHTPAYRCIWERQIEIVEHLHAAEELGVPAGLMLAVAFQETHVGCDAGEGGGWGAPISRTQRHTAGTPEHAAHALAWSYTVCSTWEGAVTRFRSGLCSLSPAVPRNHDALEYVRVVMHRTGVLYGLTWGIHVFPFERSLPRCPHHVEGVGVEALTVLDEPLPLLCNALEDL